MNEDELMKAATRRLDEESTDISIDDDAAEVAIEEPAATAPEQPVFQPAPHMDARERCLAFIRGGKGPLSHSIHIHMRRFSVGPERIKQVLQDLERDGLIEKFQAFKGPAYRVPGRVPVAPAAAPMRPAPKGCLCARTAPDVNYGCPVHGGAVKKKETTMSKTAAEWISTEETAKILGVTTSRVTQLGRTKRIASRKTGGMTSPREYLRSSVAIYVPSGGGEPRRKKEKQSAATDLLEVAASPRKPPKAKSARAAKAIEEVAEKHAEERPASATDPVRWIVDGWKLGQFSADEAITRVGEAVR